MLPQAVENHPSSPFPLCYPSSSAFALHMHLNWLKEKAASQEQGTQFKSRSECPFWSRDSGSRRLQNFDLDTVVILLSFLTHTIPPCSFPPSQLKEILSVESPEALYTFVEGLSQ